MANKNKKNQIHQANQRRVKQQQYEAATKNLSLFSFIALGISVLLLFLLFVSFADVYNTTAGVGVEVKVSGWSFAIAALTDTYSSADSVYGNLAVPFYYYAGEWCETLAIFALFSVLIMVLNIVVQIFAAVKKIYVLNAVSAILSVIAAILLIVCFVEGLAMKNGEILTTYCSNNPACSIRSFAIIPAIVALGSAAVSTVATVKHAKASRLLK
ncbi:MAG: hypothetical protein J1F66_01190 [Clostridiales bacterium]|nr:hypothetical protein [Clostridiales bacterium]